MSEQQQKFVSYLDGRIAACKQRGKQLTEDDRADEGNLEKIRANVYDIFKTVLSVAGRVCGGDGSAERDFFLQKTEEIPAGWKASYEKARQNGDARKMHIEGIKLDTVREIRDRYLQIREETI